MKTYADGIGTLYNTLKDNNLDSSVASAAKGASDLAAGAVTLDAGIDSALAGAGALATGQIHYQVVLQSLRLVLISYQQELHS